MKNEQVTRSLRGLAALAVAFALGACSAETESGSEGSCKLSCPKKYVAASDYEIVTIVQPPEEMTVSCTESEDDPNKGDGIAAISSPLQVRFQIFRKLGSTTSTSAEAPASGDTTASSVHPTFPPLAERVPVQGVGFEPVLFGIMAVEKTHPDLLIDPTTVSSGKFAGVETPPSEWCSDSCGIMTYEFRPACVTGVDNSLSASVLAGAAKPPAAVKIKLGGG